MSRKQQARAQFKTNLLERLASFDNSSEALDSEEKVTKLKHDVTMAAYQVVLELKKQGLVDENYKPIFWCRIHRPIRKTDYKATKHRNRTILVPKFWEPKLYPANNDAMDLMAYTAGV